MARVGGSGKITRKVCKVGVGSGWTPGYMVREECKREKMRTKMESRYEG